jgi:hypothetical protein
MLIGAFPEWRSPSSEYATFRFSECASEDSNLNTNDLPAFGGLSAQWNEHDAIWLPTQDSNLQPFG